jgi:hypothetical protein
MNYLSFSLWGDKPIYNVGAIKNSELSKKIYPNWKMIIYYDNTVPKKTIEELKKNEIELIDMTGSKIYGEFWRFLCVENDNSEYSIFRDCDSRINFREKFAVDEWINSKKTLHIMRDHPAHKIPFGNDSIGILAGMWGIKGSIKNIRNEILEFQKENKHVYGVDQKFLKKIYSKYINDNCTHDEFFEKNLFQLKGKILYLLGVELTNLINR